jgi:hypothetical protein
MMLAEEIIVDGVFVVALVAALGCFAYLLYATLLERHLLRTATASMRVAARTARRATSPSAAPLASKTERWHRRPGYPSLPEGRG